MCRGGEPMSAGPGKGRAPSRKASLELTKLLQAHRRARDPRELGLPPREEGGRGRPVGGPSETVGLSQAQVAELALMDPASYGKFERGALPRVTDEQIYAVARVLGMDNTVLDRMFVLIRGEYPRTPGASRDPNNHLREIVEDMVAWEISGEKGIIFGPLAYTTDPFYNVTACNEGFATLFGEGGIPKNVLTWGLLGGDGRLLQHDLYLLNEARLRVAVLERSHGDDPRFREIDELFSTLPPPSDSSSAYDAKGLQEAVFPFQPLGYAAGSMRSSETHITGVGGLSDGSSFFVLTFYENVEPGELAEMASGGQIGPRSKVRRLPK
ncbi:helix-turn-helix domain-containing protein [Streptomyces niveus]|uniref:helix-turn-helix domain-containing protein n=1 Tax=Streptomyces niveus TaxID=193462 RepID=UPI0036CBCB51